MFLNIRIESVSDNITWVIANSSLHKSACVNLCVVRQSGLVRGLVYSLMMERTSCGNSIKNISYLSHIDLSHIDLSQVTYDEIKDQLCKEYLE